MNNTQLLRMAVDLIEGVDEAKTETVEIKTDKYDNGSSILTVDITFLSPEECTKGMNT